MQSSTSSSKRLETYSALARSLRKTHAKESLLTTAAKGTLSVALPTLMAALPTYSAQAQCRSVYMSRFPDVGSCSVLIIDLDGDNVYDVSLASYGTRASLVAINTTANLSVLGYMAGFPFMNNLSTGDAITNADPAFMPITNFAYFFNSNFGQFSSGNSGNIAFKLNGKLGFIDISSFDCISVSNFGVNPTPGMAVQAGICGTLPVELTAFRATAGKEKIQLFWETATETNNVGFEIQRSTDGKQFHEIGWLDGHGTTVEPQSYTFEDKKIVANQPYFYRLRQVDIDGSYNFSDVVKSVWQDKTRAIIGDVFPNPATDKAMLYIAVAKESDVLIELFDTVGKKLTTTRTELTTGNNEIPLDLSYLPKGTFFAKIKVGEEQQYRKIVKQ